MASQNCIHCFNLYDQFQSPISQIHLDCLESLCDSYGQFQPSISQNRLDYDLNSDKSSSSISRYHLESSINHDQSSPLTIKQNCTDSSIIYDEPHLPTKQNCLASSINYDQFPLPLIEHNQSFPALPIRQWIRSGIHLGDGSFGHVSLAFDPHSKTAFAIKSAANSNSIHHKEALLNELQILKSLDSPRIVKLLGSSDASGSIFLEYMDGGSVADTILRQGPLPEQAVQQITRAVVEGLVYLHSRGIVHCDIKSHNILLCLSTGSAKIADLGSAKIISTTASEQASSPSSFCGSPLYMAPEVLHGVQQRFASDIWSLGCTVVHMLQGRPPFATVAAAAAGDISDSDLCGLAASYEAADFVKNCLVKDPRSRLTAAQLLQHPFLRQADGCCRNVAELVGPNRYSDSFPGQLSPRSVLHMQDSSLDSEGGAIENSVAHHAASSIRNDENGNRRIKEIESSGKWITVRQSDGWTDDRERLFTLDRGGRGHGHEIVKLVDVRPLASILWRRQRP